MKPQKHKKEIIAWANGAVIDERMIGASQWNRTNHPTWRDDCEYRASIADVEGKPVFEGDELYSPDGHKFVVNKMCAADKLGINEACSWNPPKPKTITVFEGGVLYDALESISTDRLSGSECAEIAKAALAKAEKERL